MECGYFLLVMLTFMLLIQTINSKEPDKDANKSNKPTASKRDLETQSSKKTEKRGLDLPRSEAFSYTYVVQNHGKLRKVIHVASEPHGDSEDTPYGVYEDHDAPYHNLHDTAAPYHNVHVTAAPYHNLQEGAPYNPHYSPEYDYHNYNQEGDYESQVPEDGYSHNEFLPEGFRPDLFSGEQIPYLGPVYVTAKPVLASPEFRKAPVPSVPARLSYPLFTPYHGYVDDTQRHPHQTKITYPLHIGKTYVLPYNTRPFDHPSPPDKSLLVYASPSPSYVVTHDGETGLYNTLKFSPTVIPYTVQVNMHRVDRGRALLHASPTPATESEEIRK
ncbi:hypothetical protein LSTR_LSTR011716 [Laodelphax striatellus]|uniref:DUF4794 domain-containing protein n=1 Tax=Laodelphax striatellus TaxID=195883 RepID=A0A482WRQ8_LAOST|nr:hypothetical protein LSTR_LSTR011716 [Laodelphax striatellus]